MPSGGCSRLRVSEPGDKALGDSSATRKAPTQPRYPVDSSDSACRMRRSLRIALLRGTFLKRLHALLKLLHAGCQCLDGGLQSDNLLSQGNEQWEIIKPQRCFLGLAAFTGLEDA